jgi:hypothetical protein
MSAIEINVGAMAAADGLPWLVAPRVPRAGRWSRA